MDASLAESLFGEEIYQIPGKVLVVLSKEWNDVSIEEKNQLSKILQALKLKLESVQIITKEVIVNKDLIPFSPSKIISFGVPFSPAIKQYENVISDGVSAIHANTLDSLDDLKKRNLWLALKTMFSV